MTNNEIKLGSQHGGGTVFWLSENGTNGLIMASGVRHSCDWDEAVRLAKNYQDLEGHNDWRLPNKDELNKVYEYCKVNSLPTYDRIYWSCSDSCRPHLAWVQCFSDGTQCHDAIKTNYYFGGHAIRSFNNLTINNKQENKTMKTTMPFLALMPSEQESILEMTNINNINDCLNKDLDTLRNFYTALRFLFCGPLIMEAHQRIIKRIIKGKLEQADETSFYATFSEIDSLIQRLLERTAYSKLIKKHSLENGAFTLTVAEQKEIADAFKNDAFAVKCHKLAKVLASERDLTQPKWR